MIMKQVQYFYQLVIILSTSSFLFGSDITSKKIIQNVKDTMTSAKTLMIDFEEQYIWKLTDEKTFLKGQLTMEGEDRFRVTTEDQIIVSDGEMVWTYSIPSNRVLIDQLEKTMETLLPKRIFVHYTKDYTSRLLGEESVLSTDCYVVELCSEKSDEFISQVKVWIDKKKWVPKQIEQIDIMGNITRYLIHEIKMGIQIDKMLFSFEIPDDAEVIEMR